MAGVLNLSLGKYNLTAILSESQGMQYVNTLNITGLDTLTQNYTLE